MFTGDCELSPENSRDSNQNMEIGLNHSEASSALRAMATDARPMKFISLLTNNVVTNSASNSPEKQGSAGSADSTSPQPKGCYGDDNDRQSSGSAGSVTEASHILSSSFGDMSRTRSLLTQSYAEQMGAFTLGTMRGDYRPYESPSLRSLLRTGRASLDSAPPGEEAQAGVNSDNREGVAIKQEPVDSADQTSMEENVHELDMSGMQQDNEKCSPDSADKLSSPHSEPSLSRPTGTENKRKGIPQQYIRNGHDSNEEGTSDTKYVERNSSDTIGSQFTSIRSALINRGAALQQNRAPMVSLLKHRQARTVSSYLGAGSLLSTALSAPTSSHTTFPRAAGTSVTGEADTDTDLFRSAGMRKSPDASMSCSYCGIVYFDQTLYFLHKALHSDSNPWKCNVCGLQCQNKYDFNSHILSIAHN